MVLSRRGFDHDGAQCRTGGLRDASSLIEIDALAMGSHSTGLACSCDPYTCECAKNCFCRIRSGAYSGARIVPPPGLGPLASHDGVSVHSCSCDMLSVGGNGLQPGNTIDCECATAECQCLRRCKCKASDDAQGG